MNSPLIVVGCYARLFGSVRNQGGNKTIMIFKIETLPSINDLTTHLLEVLNARYTAEDYFKVRLMGIELIPREIKRSFFFRKQTLKMVTTQQLMINKRRISHRKQIILALKVCIWLSFKRFVIVHIRMVCP